MSQEQWMTKLTVVFQLTSVLNFLIGMKAANTDPSYTVVLKQSCPYNSKQASTIILSELKNPNVKATEFIDIGSFHAFVIVGLLETSMSTVAKSQWVAFIEPQTEIHTANTQLHHVSRKTPTLKTPFRQLVKKENTVSEKLSKSQVNSKKETNSGLILVQQNAPWNLSRICRRNTFAHMSDYFFNSYGCADVDAYVLDTGIDVKHAQFEGRASNAANFSSETSNDDLSGHGTHVAGVIGAQIYGVCKKIQIKSVKILNGAEAGSSLSLLLALDWVAKNRDLSKKNIINLSVSGPWSPAINQAINQFAKLNVVVVAAAGNQGGNACCYSPSGANGVLTVGATTQSDAIEIDPPSNYGVCVNLYAPGYEIPSTHMGGGVAVMSGTSMAAAHGTGGIASFWSKTSLTALQVIQLLMNSGTSVTIGGMREGVNARSLILFVQY